MIRLIVAFAIALAFPAGPGFAEHGGGHAQGGGQGSFDELHDRIDQADSISDEDKERLHQTVDTVKGETDKARKATALIDELQAQGLIANDPAEKARIDSEIQAQLDLIEEGRSTLEETQRDLEAKIEASDELTREQKDEVLGTLRDFADKRITEAQAKSVLEELLQHRLSGFQCESTCVYVVELLLLWIALVIIGAHTGAS
jgi:chromosome segregation ATPase